MADREYGFRTRAIHAGNIPDSVTGARALPIYQSTAFVFDDTSDAAARFALQKYGNIYSRLANPTVSSFEGRVASLEGGLGAVATASGLSAQYITFASLVGSGDHIVASANLYGGSITQLDVTLRRFGVETTFVQSANAEDYAKAITPQTKLIFAETIANPSGEIADLEALADVAHAH
ncbi:MAG: aminotransferase class I/II-fold pyridoxal phosphate-dependent enzyme, partial [Mycetocola sp.]